MIKHYEIGGLTLAIENKTLREKEGLWPAFAVEERPADLHCRVDYTPELPAALRGQRRGHILVSDSERIYLAVDTDLPYAHVKEVEGGLQIRIPQERYPWGERMEELFELLALPHLLLSHRRLLLHGAYVAYAGYGLLFTGSSGIGKTTQARLWQSFLGASSVNEDRCIVCPAAQGAEIYGVPVAGSSPVCKNITLPLRAIVVLSQGKENRLELLRPAAAAARLMDGTYQLPAFREDIPAACDLCLDLAAHMPVYHLSCRPDEEAVRLLHNTLFA